MSERSFSSSVGVASEADDAAAGLHQYPPTATSAHSGFASVGGVSKGVDTAADPSAYPHAPTASNGRRSFSPSVNGALKEVDTANGPQANPHAPNVAGGRYISPSVVGVSEGVGTANGSPAYPDAPTAASGHSLLPAGGVSKQGDAAMVTSTVTSPPARAFTLSPPAEREGATLRKALGRKEQSLRRLEMVRQEARARIAALRAETEARRAAKSAAAAAAKNSPSTEASGRGDNNLAVPSATISDAAISNLPTGGTPGITRSKESVGGCDDAPPPAASGGTMTSGGRTPPRTPAEEGGARSPRPFSGRAEASPSGYKSAAGVTVLLDASNDDDLPASRESLLRRCTDEATSLVQPPIFSDVPSTPEGAGVFAAHEVDVTASPRDGAAGAPGEQLVVCLSEMAPHQLPLLSPKESSTDSTRCTERPGVLEPGTRRERARAATRPAERPRSDLDIDGIGGSRSVHDSGFTAGKNGLTSMGSGSAGDDGDSSVALFPADAKPTTKEDAAPAAAAISSSSSSPPPPPPACNLNVSQPGANACGANAGGGGEGSSALAGAHVVPAAEMVAADIAGACTTTAVGECKGGDRGAEDCGNVGESVWGLSGVGDEAGGGDGGTSAREEEEGGGGGEDEVREGWEEVGLFGEEASEEVS